LPVIPDLDRILEQTRPAIEAALAEAESELAALDTRRGELTSLIARAKAVLGSPIEGSAAKPAGRMTLHHAMQLVISERGNEWTSVHDLAREINSRRLYEKRDRTAVDPSQVHARANKYPQLFDKDGPNVRLR
jgi:chorismate mutase